MMRSKSILPLLFLALVSSPLGSHAQHHHHAFLRGLKGGGGGGGGGGSRGGSSYTNSSRNTNCNGEACGETATIIVAILAVMGALGGLCVWRFRKHQNNNNNNNKVASLPKASSSKKSFDDSVTTARSEQAASFSGFQSHDPKSGTYTYVYNYKQNRKTKEGTVVLYFTEDNGRYKLSGSTADDDGVATIDEGFATYDGNAWWKETNVTGEYGLQILNKGQFDFSNSTFEGEWWANTGLSGTFVSFVLEQEGAEDTEIPSAPPETAVGGAQVPFSMALWMERRSAILPRQ